MEDILVEAEQELYQDHVVQQSAGGDAGGGGAGKGCSPFPRVQ